METVLLLPAAGMTHRMWRRQVEGLTGRFEVLTPDLPGHGGLPGPFSFELAVAEVSAQIDRTPGPVHLCGLSLSATVAVLTCLARPERVRGLVLSGGIAHPPPALAIQRALVAAMPERMIAGLLARQLRRTVARLPPGERAATIAEGAADFRAVGKRTYQASLRQLARTDLRARLSQVRIPTLVLCGARDKANLRGSRDLASGIAGAELRIVPDAGRLWNLEHPELFTRTLADFVGKVT